MNAMNVDRDNVIVAARYGSHANDHWFVEDVLALARKTG
jgi:hypothetical protein